MGHVLVPSIVETGRRHSQMRLPIVLRWDGCLFRECIATSFLGATARTTTFSNFATLSLFLRHLSLLSSPSFRDGIASHILRAHHCEAIRFLLAILTHRRELPSWRDRSLRCLWQTAPKMRAATQWTSMSDLPARRQVSSNRPHLQAATITLTVVHAMMSTIRHLTLWTRHTTASRQQTMLMPNMPTIMILTKNMCMQRSMFLRCTSPVCRSPRRR